MRGIPESDIDRAPVAAPVFEEKMLLRWGAIYALSLLVFSLLAVATWQHFAISRSATSEIGTGKRTTSREVVAKDERSDDHKKKYADALGQLMLEIKAREAVSQELETAKADLEKAKRDHAEQLAEVEARAKKATDDALSLRESLNAVAARSASDQLALQLTTTELAKVHNLHAAAVERIKSLEEAVARLAAAGSTDRLQTGAVSSKPNPGSGAKSSTEDPSTSSSEVQKPAEISSPRGLVGGQPNVDIAKPLTSTGPLAISPGPSGETVTSPPIALAPVVSRGKASGGEGVTKQGETKSQPSKADPNGQRTAKEQIKGATGGNTVAKKQVATQKAAPQPKATSGFWIFGNQ